MSEMALFGAALVLFVTGLVHSVLGERALIGPLLAPGTRTGILEKSEFFRQIVRFAWHLTTLAWWALAAILVSLVKVSAGELATVTLVIIAVMCFLSGVYILAAARGRHLAWILFLAAGGLCLVPLV